MDLAAMAPDNALASTGYCLANPGGEYLIYQPISGAFTAKLAAEAYQAEWFEVGPRRTFAGGSVRGSGTTRLEPPFSGSGVLYLIRRGHA
jgi:hypothetical protein